MKFFTWETVELETMSDVISRKVISGEKAMVAQVFLKKDAVVPEHHHESEQITYIVEGALTSRGLLDNHRDQNRILHALSPCGETALNPMITRPDISRAFKLRRKAKPADIILGYPCGS